MENTVPVINSLKKEKKPSKFKGLLKRIFVVNIGYKILSPVLAIVLWMLWVVLS